MLRIGPDSPCPAPFGPRFARSPSIAGAMQNSFSWPAKQVSYKDVANKNAPGVLVEPEEVLTPLGRA